MKAKMMRASECASNPTASSNASKDQSSEMKEKDPLTRQDGGGEGRQGGHPRHPPSRPVLPLHFFRRAPEAEDAVGFEAHSVVPIIRTFCFLL